MTLHAAFSRVAHSSSLRFVLGSTAYGAYLNSKEMILANALAVLAVVGVNLAKRSAPYEFIPTGISNIASGAIGMGDALHHISGEGMTLSNWGRLSVSLAYIGWATAEVMKTRLNVKGIETPDKKWLDPTIPNGIADVLAVGNFPPLMLTSAAAIVKQIRENPLHEETPVSTTREFINKHLTGTRLLAVGMLTAGVAGAVTGLGLAYTTAFMLWTAGYTSFEPKRNAALLPDLKKLRPGV